MFGLSKKKELAGDAEPSVSPPAEYIVQYDRRGCIGAGVCEAFAPDFFTVHPDKKAELKGSVLNTQNTLFERPAGEDDFPSLKQAAEGCPTNVIHIINRKTGEKLI